jgi:vacuolar-type H+-ATPase subunit E/Vma4
LEEEAREAASQAALLEAKTQVLSARAELLQQEMAFYKAGDKTNSLRFKANFLADYANSREI